MSNIHDYIAHQLDENFEDRMGDRSGDSSSERGVNGGVGVGGADDGDVRGYPLLGDVATTFLY